MGRSSSIVGKPIQARVDQLLDLGNSLQEISALTGAHPSSVWRYSQLRKNHLARAVDGEPGALDLVARLTAVAEAARQDRLAAAASGSHAARARATKLEADVLRALMSEVGVSDISQGEVNGQVEALVVALREFASQHPEHAAPLVDALSADPSTQQLGRALATQIGRRS